MARVNPFLKGLIAGGAATAATMMGYAYGTDEGRRRAAVELEAECVVEVGFAQTSFGSQCYFDQVMVGARDGEILCADLTVDCPDS